MQKPEKWCGECFKKVVYCTRCGITGNDCRSSDLLECKRAAKITMHYCRRDCPGQVCLGCGKVGAVVGTFIYAPLADAFGIAMVMWIQCVLCLVGVVLSIYCIADDHPRTKGMRETLI